jgi:hypothetical protein
LIIKKEKNMNGYGRISSEVLWDAGDIDNGDVMCPFCDRACVGERCQAWRYDKESPGRGFCVRMMAECENASKVKYQNIANFSFERGLAYFEEMEARKLACPYANRNCCGENCAAWSFHHSNVGCCLRLIYEIQTAEVDHSEFQDNEGEKALAIGGKTFDPAPF